MSSEDPHPLSYALYDLLTTADKEASVEDDDLNVVDGLLAIARGLNSVAEAIHRLGVNHADGRMGAVELLSFEVRELRLALSDRPVDVEH